jgi:hypothetical protein
LLQYGAGHILIVFLVSWSLGRRMVSNVQSTFHVNQAEIIQSSAYLGGKVEKCETNSDALKRGVREETDADVTSERWYWTL